MFVYINVGVRSCVFITQICIYFPNEILDLVDVNKGPEIPILTNTPFSVFTAINYLVSLL